jgi:hypothetical protein
LLPGQEVVFTRSKRLFKRARRTIKAAVDYLHMVRESNEKNNFIKSSVFWRLPSDDKYTIGAPKKCSDGTDTYNPN